MFFKPTFCPKNAQKSKSCSRLPEPQRDVPVCPNAKSCSKVAEHNWDRPTSQILGRPQANMTLWDFVRLWICKSRENVWKYTIHTSWIPFFWQNRNDSPCVHCVFRGTQRQFSGDICSEDDFRSRIFETFVVKISWLPASSRIFKHIKNGIIVHFWRIFYPKKVTYNFWKPFFWLKFSKR